MCSNKCNCNINNHEDDNENGNRKCHQAPTSKFPNSLWDLYLQLDSWLTRYQVHKTLNTQQTPQRVTTSLPGYLWLVLGATVPEAFLSREITWTWGWLSAMALCPLACLHSEVPLWCEPVHQRTKQELPPPYTYHGTILSISYSRWIPEAR